MVVKSRVRTKTWLPPASPAGRARRLAGPTRPCNRAVRGLTRCVLRLVFSPNSTGYWALSKAQRRFVPLPHATLPVTTLAHAPSEHLLPGQHLIPSFAEVQGAHRVRFARTEADLEAVQRLRFAVFNLELGEGFEDSFATGRDEDEFDLQCQHLIVETADANEVIGTYRMQTLESASAGAGFYSQGEFELSTIPESMLASAVELGRACVAREHRSRRALFLLWRGLYEYVTFNAKTACFGCSSLTSQDPAEGMRLYDGLREQGRVHPTVRVEPHEHMRCRPSGSIAGPPVPVPTLFGIYLRHGAYVLGPPAIDREFGTIDYLTHLQVQRSHAETFGGRPR